MADDIVTRLRNNFATKDYPMLKDHCHCCAIPKEWGGHHDNCLYDQAADEIERLRALLDVIVERENIDNARQLQIVRKVEADRDRWRNICDYWYKASCSHNWRQDQAARRKYEQAVSGE